MAIRNPAARNSAVIPKNVTTRIVRRGPGFCRRAVYVRGVFTGYTVSHLGYHEAWAKDGSQIFAESGDKGYPYLSDAVVAASEQGNRCKGWATAGCGTVIPPEADLCGDCGMARMDAQSPRIPV
jgi:hypothetical protein